MGTDSHIQSIRGRRCRHENRSDIAGGASSSLGEVCLCMRVLARRRVVVLDSVNHRSRSGGSMLQARLSQRRAVRFAIAASLFVFVAVPVAAQECQTDTISVLTDGTILSDGLLQPGFELGVDSDKDEQEWVICGGTPCPDCCRLATVPNQEWLAAFIVVDRLTDPPRPGVDVSSFDCVEIDLRGETGEEIVDVGLKDVCDEDRGREVKRRLDLSGRSGPIGTPVAGGWTRYRLPRSTFTSANPSYIYVLMEFVFDRLTPLQGTEPPQTISVRNIRFTNGQCPLATVTPALTPTLRPSPTMPPSPTATRTPRPTDTPTPRVVSALDAPVSADDLRIPVPAEPASPTVGVAVIDDEQILFVGRDENGLVVVRRGFCGTIAQAHEVDTEVGFRPICIGDCNCDGAVLLDELMRGVAAATGNAGLAECLVFDPSGSGSVEVNELIHAVQFALHGCPQ